MPVKYLENPYCEFATTFDFDPNIKKNIIIISLFMMSSMYKELTQYTDGIKLTIELKKTLFPDFIIRMFVDQNIYDNPDLQWLKKHCEMVIFKCPTFLKDDRFHLGTFGAFVRFFPAYDFKNNDANHIITVDADINEYELKHLSLSYYKLHEINDLYFYNYGSRLTFKNMESDIPRLFAGRMINLKKIDQTILINMLDKMKNNDVDDIKTYYKQSNKVGEGVMRYGIDEYYLKEVLVPICIKNNYLFATSVRFSISEIAYNYKQNNYYSPEIKEFVTYCLGVHYDKKLSFNQNYVFFDKLMYNNFQKSEIQEYITKRFYYLLLIMNRDKKYGKFGKNNIQKLITSYMGCACVDGIIFFNSKQHDIIPVLGIAKYDMSDLKI
jgi:hypothetical protein